MPGAVTAGQSMQKHSICIIFNKTKFAHTREIFKELKILNIYQLSILSNIIFMHRVENKTTFHISNKIL